MNIEKHPCPRFAHERRDMKNWQKVRELDKILLSILCLCSEGPEFHTKLELVDIIAKEANKGLEITKGEGDY